jgi:NADP-dependent 3-hydroxy acid dehydrogenase YdfG
VFLGTKLAAEQMAKTGGGSIVNISSIMGFVGSTSGHPAYHASKGPVRSTPKPPRSDMAHPISGSTPCTLAICRRC